MKPEQRNLWSQLVARAWQDEAFKKRLLADPAGVLKAHGLEVPPGVQVRLMEDTEQVIHLALPRKPDVKGELSEEDLTRIAGGFVEDPCAGGRAR
jgi:Nitrile hydratase, alpha chain